MLEKYGSLTGFLFWWGRGKMWHLWMRVGPKSLVGSTRDKQVSLVVCSTVCSVCVCSVTVFFP